MMKSTPARFTKKGIAALLIAGGIIICGVSSCTAPGNCWAYQDSKKSSRSVKPRHHAEVIHLNNNHQL